MPPLGQDRIARLLQLGDLLHHQFQPIEDASDPCRGVGRELIALRCPQCCALRAPVPTQRPVAGDAKCRQQAVDLVEQCQALANQPLPLAHRPPPIFLGRVGDRHHRAHARLTPQPRQQRAHQHLDIQRVRLGAACPPVDEHTRRLDDVEPPPRALPGSGPARTVRPAS
jgi:hypothetical protein